MILLIVPLGQLTLGGISEKYLPPNNPVRQAQEDFDRTFPGFAPRQLTLVIQNANPAQVDEIKSKAARISGFTKTWDERTVSTDPDGNPGTKTDPNVTVLENGLQNRNEAPNKIEPAALDSNAQGHVDLGGWHAGARAGQHPQPVRQAAADDRDPDHHDDAADVPGVRVAGAAHQGGRDERTDARIDAGHA